MRIISVDCSSKKLSFTILEDGQLESYGEIYFKDAAEHIRLMNTRKQLEDILPLLGRFDYCVFEAAVNVRSVKTMIVLAKAFGVAVSVLAEQADKLVEITPIAWQSAIGNPNVKPEERRELLAKHPELKSKSQQQNFLRNYRKNRTMDYVEKRFGIRMENNDLSDSAGIGAFWHDKIKAMEANV